MILLVATIIQWKYNCTATGTGMSLLLKANKVLATFDFSEWVRHVNVQQ